MFRGSRPADKQVLAAKRGLAANSLHRGCRLRPDTASATGEKKPSSLRLDGSGCRIRSFNTLL